MRKPAVDHVSGILAASLLRADTSRILVATLMHYSGWVDGWMYPTLC